MDRNELEFLVKTLRQTTTAVQILPFVYSALYTVLLATYQFVPEQFQATMDNLFYVSPVCMVAFLILSKTLRMCRWHKTACIIPIIPQVVNFIDCNVVMLSKDATIVFNVTLIIMVALLLFAAYKVFFK